MNPDDLPATPLEGRVPRVPELPPRVPNLTPEYSETESGTRGTRPSRQRSWIWLIVVFACVVAVITIVFLMIPPKPEPVKVRFVGTTNELGEKKLVFEGTNGMPKHVYYVACIATGAERQATIPSGLRLGYGLTSSVVAVQTNFYFTLNAPSNGLPYHVMYRFQALRPAMTPRERLRVAAFDFFRAHGMRRIASVILNVPAWHYIPSTEIKE